MFLFRVGGFVLRHDARQRMRHIGRFQIRGFLLRQLKLRCFHGAVHMMEFGRADHGRSGLRQQPRQGDFRHGHAALFSELCHAGNDHIVLGCRGVILELRVGIFLGALCPAFPGKPG